MPTFSSADFQYFIASFKSCFSFIMNTLHGLIDIIRAYPLFFMTLFLLMLLGVAFWVCWLIMEVAPNAGGSEFQNPYKAFSNPSRVFANPNRQFDTKMPLWSSVGLGLIRRHKQNKYNEQKAKIEAVNQKKADEFFRRNPNYFRLHIDGKTYLRKNFEKRNYQIKRKDN